MFKRKPLKRFHVSTARVYFAGKKNWAQKIQHFIRPYARRGVYRMATGSLLAL